MGRRLAFDAARGRLWAVCTACGRWNLSPLEERWEAIEECERHFREARLRTQTEEIGLAQLPEGLQLVRIGAPLRPEFAAWRYGDVLGARRRQALRKLAGGGILAGAGAAAGAATGVLTGAAVLAPLLLAWPATVGMTIFMAYREYGRTFRVPGAEGRVHTVFGANLGETALLPGEEAEGWQLRLREARGFVTLQGATARTALGVLLPRVNELGAGDRPVRDASNLVAESGGPDSFLRLMAAESARRTGDYFERRAAFRRDPWGAFRMKWDLKPRFGNQQGPTDEGALPHLPRTSRLALEMALHEETERRALEGELGMLKAAWREAEEIAAVSDRLLTPAAVEERLEALRRERERQPR